MSRLVREWEREGLASVFEEGKTKQDDEEEEEEEENGDKFHKEKSSSVIIKIRFTIFQRQHFTLFLGLLEVGTKPSKNITKIFN